MVAARFIRNDRLTDALMAQAFAALTASPGARALYDAQRARGTEHNPALRKVANRLVGILHGDPAGLFGQAVRVKSSRARWLDLVRSRGWPVQ